VIDEPSLPLIESNFAHFIALEVLYMPYIICISLFTILKFIVIFIIFMHLQGHVTKLSKDYKNRRMLTTLHKQIHYVRNIPDFYQTKDIVDS